MDAPLTRGFQAINLCAVLPVLFILCLWTNQICVSQEVNSHDAILLDKIKPKVDYALDSDGNVISISAKGTKSGFDAFGKFSKLRELSIVGSGWDGLNDLSQLSALKQLTLIDNSYSKEVHTCPALPSSLESLQLYLTGLDPKNTLTIVGKLTNLTSLSLPSHCNGEYLLELGQLKKLSKLWLVAFMYKDGVFSRYSPHEPGFCFQLLVDLQGRSIKEACDVLSLLKNDEVTLHLTDKTTPYLNRLQGVTKLDLNLRFVSQAGLNTLELPAQVESLFLRYGQISEILLKKMSGLQRLELYQCRTGGDTLSTFKSSNSLKALHINSLEKKRLTISSDLNRLEELSLCGSGLEIDNLSGIASLSSLKKLKLSIKNKIDDSFLENLAGLKRLNQVELSDATVTADNAFNLFVGLESQPQLTVDVGSFEFVKEESGLEFTIRKNTPVSNEVLKRIANLKNLKGISIATSSNLITADVDRVVKLIEKFEQVERVVLLNFTPSVNSVFGVLDSLKSKKLVWLKFGRGYAGFSFKKNESGVELRIGKEMLVTSQLLSKILSLKTLQKINFNRCSLQQEDLPELAQLEARKISFTNCENVTDKTVELLSRNQNIKSLRFYRCDKITDEALVHLKKMTWLETLKIEYEDRSETTLESLKSEPPNHVAE